MASPTAVKIADLGLAGVSPVIITLTAEAEQQRRNKKRNFSLLIPNLNGQVFWASKMSE